MRIFEIVFVTGKRIIEFADNRQSIWKKYDNIDHINRIYII